MSFPLSAVVGQSELKRALLLHAVDPGLGGVLIRGQKGSAKSTAARALAALLPEGAPFVELPIGATDDRVVGSLDLRAALVEGEQRLRPGLLAEAHGGVLYADEVNLLPDHLVDVLLDAAASGTHRVERDGMAVEHPARFVLVGSMNPEEGELRPQLLDRFGLSVEVAAPLEPAARAEAVRRRLAHDADPAAFAARFAESEQELARSIARARDGLAGVVVPDDVLVFAAALCAQVGAEGLRADLVLARGVAALAALDGRDEATRDDVMLLAPLALAHRRRRGPFDEPRLDRADLEAAAERAEASVAGEEAPEAAPVPPDPDVPVTLAVTRPSGTSGRRARGEAPTGALVGDRPFADGDPGPASSGLAVSATARAAALRRALEPGGPPVAAGDLRAAVRESRTASLVVFAVDASGSMGAERRMEAAKGAVLTLLLDAYQRRDRIAVVTFRGEEADVVLRPTASVEVARARLAELPTGGRTPLAEGIRTALATCRGAMARDGGRRPVIVLVTDGRATHGADPVAEALAAAAEVARSGVEALVVDAEDGAVPLGLAHDVASAMGARYVRLPDLAPAPLARAVTEALGEVPARP